MKQLPEIPDAAGRVVIRDATRVVVCELNAGRGEWLALCRGARETGEAVDWGRLVNVADPFRSRDTDQVHHAAA